ncbi:helix-turn-helix domain-containing protein [Clostridium oryzae]|uniref:RCS-specific HTH-type transcriptional activator RclR n=1 Tax=Clostridium oryzae TaxID=1450648 RepID=A0A1V4IPE6_9CLOT|nr:AraC family transcriptional regulator [Clostridium oryzae]OPJ61327.1 RCS-specific HTH-type transcriptional activator RclR [Clostridium oryzae]
MNLDFNVVHAGYNKKEITEFTIDRPLGSSEYLFIHFLCDTNVRIDSKLYKNSYGACLIYEPGFPQWYGPANGKFQNSYFHFECEDFKILADKFQLPLNKIFYCKNDDFIEMSIRDIEAEYILKDLYFRESIDGILMHLFSCIGRFCSPNRNNDIDPSKIEMRKKFKMVRLKILQKPEYDWKLKEMADLLNISTSRFCTYYREFFHVSPKADLIMTRIGKAKYLLTNQALSVEEAAELLGYNNVFHFIRQFKAITGFTPGKYSKR